jgi:hypothetical protein
MIDVTNALLSLTPNAEWALDGSEIVWEQDTINSDNFIAKNLTWYSTNILQPSKSQIEAELVRLQAEYDAVEYQRQRKLEYPSIGDQLDALWKGGEAAAEMLARVQAIKNKYPKE